MATKIYLLVFIVFTLLSISCQTPCVKGDLRYKLVGFTDAEASTIILKRFQKNSTVVKDSFVFNPANPIRFERFADTLFMIAYTSNALLYSENDYQLIFPAAGKTVTITEIEEEQQYMTKSIFNLTKKGCGNVINSCKIDGQFTKPAFPGLISITK
jgi:hypothetical protein